MGVSRNTICRKQGFKAGGKITKHVVSVFIVFNIIKSVPEEENNVLIFFQIYVE